MKEKRYTLPEEQEPDFVAEPEPTVAYHGNAAIALPEEEVTNYETEDINWGRMPYIGGPANEEEAIARIEAIEAENERTGNHLTDIEDFERELESKYPWLV